MTEADILDEVRSFRTIRAVLNWAFARTPAAELVDAVAQDEFTHDIIVRVTPDAFLVFDTT